jgi:hypothetical protein
VVTGEDDTFALVRRGLDKCSWIARHMMGSPGVNVKNNL